MALVPATETEYQAFLDKFGFSIASCDLKHLPLSFAFLSSLPFCDDDPAQTPQITEAQLFIAYSMSNGGGGFNPTAIAGDRILIKEELGREAIVEEYQVNELLSGTDPMSLLRSMPMAFGLLSKYLCPVAVTEDGEAPFQAGIFVV